MSSPLKDEKMISADFKLGALVVPAIDSILSDLGHNVEGLGFKALGVVIEEGSRRSHVHFPELALSLWMDHNEIRDVEFETTRDEGFRKINDIKEHKLSEVPSVFVIHLLVSTLKATHVLGVDNGLLSDIWEENASKLSDYYSGTTQVQSTRLSLGLEELMPQKWEELKSQLGKRFMIERFLPSGMYKMELSVYFMKEAVGKS